MPNQAPAQPNNNDANKKAETSNPFAGFASSSTSFQPTNKGK